MIKEKFVPPKIIYRPENPPKSTEKDSETERAEEIKEIQEELEKQAKEQRKEPETKKIEKEAPQEEPLPEELELGIREEREKIKKEKEIVQEKAEIKPKEEKIIELTEVVKEEKPEGVKEKIPAKLEQARKTFIEAEKEYDKYGEGKWWKSEISKVFKRKEGRQVKEKYEKTKEKYEGTRAEYVAEHLDKFVNERMKLVDKQAEKFEKSRWKKVWDWAGKQNLEKAGWKPKGKLAKFLAKGVNLRTAVSLGLLGTGIGLGIGSAVGLSALMTRRIYAGLAVGMGSYELLRIGTERYPRLTKKKLGSIKYNQAEEIMAKYEMRAKLKGEKVGENEDYQKLRDKYLELLRKESEKADKKAKSLMKVADKKLEEMSSKLKRGDIYRKVTAMGVGTVIGVGGLHRLMEQVYGGSPEEAKEFVSQVQKPGSEAIVTPIVTPTEAPAEIPAKMPGELQPETVEGALEKLPDKFIGVAQANEGYIHEARKVLTMYIHEAGRPGLEKLTKAQRIWTEDRLWDLYREANPEAAKEVLDVGDKVEFSRVQIEQVLNEVEEKFGSPEKAAHLSENLKGYVDNIKWDRYETIAHPQMGEVYSWQLDEGVKAVDWKQELETIKEIQEIEPSEGAIEPTRPPVDWRDQINKIDPNKLEGALFNNATTERIFTEFKISPQEYDVIKNMSVQKFANEFSYWNPSKDMVYGEPDHLELWHKMKFRDTIRELLSKKPVSEDMSIHEYLKERWFGKGLEPAEELKAGTGVAVEESPGITEAVPEAEPEVGPEAESEKVGKVISKHEIDFSGGKATIIEGEKGNVISVEGHCSLSDAEEIINKTPDGEYNVNLTEKGEKMYSNITSEARKHLMIKERISNFARARFLELQALEKAETSGNQKLAEIIKNHLKSTEKAIEALYGDIFKK